MHSVIVRYSVLFLLFIFIFGGVQCFKSQVCGSDLLYSVTIFSFCQLLRDVIKSSTMVMAFFFLTVMPIFILYLLKLCYMYIQILTFDNLLMD